MNKILKSLIAFLVSLSFITPFSIYAVDDENINLGNEVDTTGQVANGSIYYRFNGQGTASYLSVGHTTNIKYTGGNDVLLFSVPVNVQADQKLKFEMQMTTNLKGVESVQYQLFDSTGITQYSGSMSYNYSQNGSYLNIELNKLNDREVTLSEIFIFVYLTKSSGNGSFTINTCNVDKVDSDEDYSSRFTEIALWLDIISTRLEVLDVDMNTLFNYLRQDINQYFSNLNEWIKTQTNSINTNITTEFTNLKDRLKNEFTDLKANVSQNFNNLHYWMQEQTSSINSKLESLLGSNSNYNDDLNDANDKNDQLSQDVNDYNELENGFHNDMNESLDNIDLNVDLITGNDFITTATFISTTMNRIVTSNKFYESFVITGLILGLALVMIGKKVI